jgi:hypothetical protein
MLPGRIKRPFEPDDIPASDAFDPFVVDDITTLTVPRVFVVALEQYCYFPYFITLFFVSTSAHPLLLYALHIFVLYIYIDERDQQSNKEMKNYPIEHGHLIAPRPRPRC